MTSKNYKTGYHKRGHFCLEKVLRKCWQDFSLGGNFHDTKCTPISFIKAYAWVLFSRGNNFCEEDKSAKNSKITLTPKCPCLQ